MSGRSIRIFLPDGSPAGLRIAELGMSTIKCVVAPRAMLVEVAARDESRRTGVYFLTGPDPESRAGTVVYVGEGDEVLARLKEHNKDETKGFWDTMYVFVSKDDALTKAHVRWLEARSVEQLRAAKRAKVVNGSNPIGGSLPEADLAEMQEFLDQIQLLLPALGFSGFEPITSGSASAAAQSTETIFRFAGKGYSAIGHLSEGNFVVRSGARSRLEEAATLPDSSKAVRATLVGSGVLSSGTDHLLLTQDYSFNSPSQAAEVVCGFSINGRSAWKLETGQTLGDWQDALLESDEPTDT